ncbi:MAG: flavin reductase family protein [Planctomycetes bacterium]|nr:flavin reductase family protein [Planctomycetota bacterium]
MEWTEENTRAVGQIIGGMYIVTAGSGDNVDGFLASWVQQASFSPLLITIAIKPGRPCYDHIIKDKYFTLNSVGTAHSHIVKPFWKGYDPDDNPFNSLAHKETEKGGVILNEAASALEAEVKEIYLPGDHDIVIAEVVKCHTIDKESTPMHHIRKSGLSY